MGGKGAVAPAHAAEASRARSRGGRGRGSRAEITRGSRRGSPQSEPSHHLRAVYDTPPRARHTKTRRRPPRFDSASRSYVTASEVHPDSNHLTTMARSLGSSMARGLGILLIMMTLSEIAATRARPAYNTKGCSLPPSIQTTRAAPPSKRAPASSAGRGDDGDARGQRRRRFKDAPPHLARQRRLRI